MKTRYILSILTATAIFAGCAKENASENIPELGENQFFATIEDGAKTILNREGDDKNKIFWKDEKDGKGVDIVSINGSLFSAAPYDDEEKGMTDHRRAIFTLMPDQDAPSGLPYVAYYPANIVDEEGVLTLPDEITYNEENPFDGVFPMYAVSAGSRNLLFKNVCGLLEIKLTGTDKITSLTVTDESKPLSGTFTIDEDHNAVIKSDGGTGGVTINCGEGVQLSNTPTVFYVPIPKETYTKFTVNANLAAGGTWSKEAVKSASIIRNKVYTLDFALSKGPLPGLFNVSSTKQVRFSPGYLYYDGSEFKFENNQFDYRTISGKSAVIDGETATTPDGQFGVFTWSTKDSGNNYGMNISTYTGSFKDWGQGYDDSGYWHTLTKEEWEYLINETARPGKHREGVEIDGMKCYVLLPDNRDIVVNKSSYTRSEWNELEAQGAVAIRYAGYRTEGVWDMEHLGKGVFVWSSTSANSSTASRFGYGEGSSGDFYNAPRDYGFYVRLVYYAPPAIETFTLDMSEMQLFKEDQAKITATILPWNARQVVEWTSNHPEIAEVDANGVVTAKALGTAVITAHSPAFAEDRTCTVNVVKYKFIDLGGSVLWQDRNLGADSPTARGDYFTFATSEVLYSWTNPEKTSLSFREVNPDSQKYLNWTPGEGFNPVNAAYYNGSQYTKYLIANCKLEDMDNAVKQIMGDEYDMPDGSAFNELIDGAKTTWTKEGNGYRITSKINGNSIYLPNGGYASGSNVNEPDDRAQYQSKEVYPGYSDFSKTYILMTSTNNEVGYTKKINAGDRRYANMIRPIKHKPTE